MNKSFVRSAILALSLVTGGCESKTEPVVSQQAGPPKAVAEPSSQAAPSFSVPQKLIEQVAEDFIALASQAWVDFKVCDHRSKTDDKRSFLSQSFEAALPATAQVHWKELSVGEEGAPSSLHLGLIAITFPTQEEATPLYTQLSRAEQPYLRNTKILTQYKALRRANTVVLIYSETFVQEALVRFFATAQLPQ
ncbi:hypothetical protein [Stigmatella hybrida]|uniref:hypothetical protein n=1 Tax=Stigmatella hybrida TaxID=394097 RepID=UPI001CDB03F5|nr:hypothetical protein [Stigmatella hybrida]